MDIIDGKVCILLTEKPKQKQKQTNKQANTNINTKQNKNKKKEKKTNKQTHTKNLNCTFLGFLEKKLKIDIFFSENLQKSYFS